MDIDNLTFIITTYKSEGTIYKCLNSLPKRNIKIVVENSNNSELKKNLEKKYENLKCYLMESNVGYGKANNFGIRISKSDYNFILNPDTILFENTVEELCKNLKNENFSIAAPIDYKDQNKYNFNKKGISEVEFVKGFAMILNRKNMFNQYFDENFFLYLEEIDLCKNIKKRNGKIFIVNTKVEHLGGLSHSNKDDFEMEKSRNWHWMWSKFYFNKKYKGYIYSLILTFPNFISSLMKYLIYKILKNNQKKTINKMRILGLLNSYMLKEASYRPYNIK